eukprot:1053532-Pleurochrysis_carterae.AAC.6
MTRVRHIISTTAFMGIGGKRPKVKMSRPTVACFESQRILLAAMCGGLCAMAQSQGQGASLLPKRMDRPKAITPDQITALSLQYGGQSSAAAVQICSLGSGDCWIRASCTTSLALEKT